MTISKLKKSIRLKRKIKEAKIISKNSKTDEKMMIFSSFAGTAYTCSPKAIYEYVIKQPEYEDYKFIWAFKKPEEKLKYFKDTRTEIIKYNSREFIKKLSIAKYWIFNFKTPEYFIKKKDQIFIQCWHGTPLKRLGCDIQIEKGSNAEKDGLQANDVIKTINGVDVTGDVQKLVNEIQNTTSDKVKIERLNRDEKGRIDLKLIQKIK